MLAGDGRGAAATGAERRRRGPRPRAARARAGRRRRHRRPPRRGRRRVLRRRRRSTLIPGERHPDGAAHGSGCTHSSRARRPPRARLHAARGGPRGARDRVGGGARRPARASARGAGPVDVLGVARPRGRTRRRRLGASARDIIARDEVPAHAPGLRRAADRRGRRRGRARTSSGSSRSSAASSTQGMWAAIPVQTESGPPRGRDGARLRRDPARRRPRHLLPARRGRSAVAAVTVALCATAIVVIALLWEVTLPYFERRARAPPRRREAASRPAHPRLRPRPRAPRRAARARAAALLRQRGGVGDVPRPGLHPGLGRASRLDKELRGVPYAYLIYPHKPIVAYLPQTGRLLNEYCVEFPDETGRTAARGCPTPTTCWPSGWRSRATSAA